MTLLENPMVVVAVVAAAAGYVIVRRAVGEPLNARDLCVPPLILVGLGVREVVRADELTGGHTAGMAVAGATALALGAWRATTVELYLRNGELWYRYRPVTYPVWIVTAVIGLAARLVLYAAFSLPASAQSLYLTVGLTLAGESLVLAGRGLRTGSPLARQGRDDEATRRLVHGEIQRSLRRRVTGDKERKFDGGA